MAPQILNPMAPQVLNFMAPRNLSWVLPGWARNGCNSNYESVRCCNGDVSYGAQRMPRARVVKAATSVLTALRVEGGSGFVRVMGPGKADANGWARNGCNRIRRNGGVSYGGWRMPRVRVVKAATLVVTASQVEGGSGFVRVMGPGKADVNGWARNGRNSNHGSVRCCSGGVSDGARRMPRVRVVKAATSVLTASRVEGGSGFVRVMGPGKADVNGIGRLLVFDEFFEFPNATGLQLRDPDVLLESVIYYCDEPLELEESSDVEEGFRPRHGVHLYLKSSMRSMKQEASSGSSESCVVETGGSLVVPVVDHVRDASSIVPITVDDGAVVRVIAGSFGDVSIGPPLQDFVMLDVQMRPGSEMSLPLDPSFGVVIYILEGVGIFEPNRFEEDEAPFYENEGHGLYIPPSQKKQASSTIRTHEWSQLRFILVGACPTV